MLKKVSIFAIVAMFFAFGCKMGKYADVKDLLEKMNSAGDTYAKSLESAKSGKEVADAMTAYSSAISGLMPEMKKMEEKYPELKNRTNPPAELKDLYQKLQDTTAKMIDVSTKVMPKYTNDPDVQKAQQNMMKAMR